MNKLLRPLFILVACASCLPVLATETAPAVATPAATAATPAAPAADATATATPAATTAAAAGEAEKVTKVPSGYKVKKIDGETMYCRKSTPMGTRFPTEVCMTLAQYEDQVRNSDAMRSELTGKQKSYSINN